MPKAPPIQLCLFFLPRYFAIRGRAMLFNHIWYKGEFKRGGAPPFQSLPAYFSVANFLNELWQLVLHACWLSNVTIFNQMNNIRGGRVKHFWAQPLSQKAYLKRFRSDRLFDQVTIQNILFYMRTH